MGMLSEFLLKNVDLLMKYFRRSDGAVDSQSASVIKLNNSTILYLREVNKFLALVCILREDNFSRQSKFTNKKKLFSVE